MTRIQESIEINCAVDKVFTYTTIAENWPKWHKRMPEAKQTSPGHVGIGTTFKGKARFMVWTSEYTTKVTKYDPYKRWSQITESVIVIIDEKLFFDLAEGGGSKFTAVHDVKLRGFLKLLSPMINSAMRKELKQVLSDLKSVLEAQT